MPTIVSRSARRVPAARIAPNDEPYSTIRCSARCHHTRCGMWWTSGCAPVASDVRQTGVSDGKVVTPRRYSPASASRESIGAERSPTACSNVDAVKPSITMRIALLRKRSQAGVLLAGAFARTKGEGRNREGLEIADDGDQCEREHDDGGAGEQQRRSPRLAAAAQRSTRKRRRAGAAEQSADRPRDGLRDAEDDQTGDARDHGADERGDDAESPGAREQAGGDHT